MNWLLILAVDGAKVALNYVHNDEKQIEQEAQPYIQDGEQGLEKWANSKSPILGAAVTFAVNDLGPDLPKLEDSAVKWFEALLKAFIAKNGG